jgi:hypothetical protein
VGVVNITGHIRKRHEGGSGVTFGLFVDGSSVFGTTLAGNDSVGVPFSFTVFAASTVDFVVGPNGDDTADGTGLRATISQTVPDAGSTLVMLGMVVGGLVLRRRR